VDYDAKHKAEQNKGTWVAPVPALPPGAALHAPGGPGRGSGRGNQPCLRAPPHHCKGSSNHHHTAPGQARAFLAQG